MCCLGLAIPVFGVCWLLYSIFLDNPTRTYYYPPKSKAQLDAEQLLDYYNDMRRYGPLSESDQKLYDNTYEDWIEMEKNRNNRSYFVDN
jgi:hypothetical protein